VPGEWSVVMTGFSGDWWLFKRTVESVFGREDLDAYKLCTETEEHLPSELSHALTRNEASQVAERLRDAGAAIAIVPSDELREVRHTAAEIWSTRCVGDLCFIEVGGLVTFGNSLEKRNILRHAPCGPKWQVEKGLNHSHPADAGPPRDKALELEADYVCELKAALKQAFPDRRFTISHVPEQAVSFWQTTPDSPREPECGQELVFVEPEERLRSEMRE